MTQLFKPIRALIACYVGLSVLGFAAVVVLRDHPDLVNTAVWVRATIALVTSVLTYLLVVRAARGDRASLIRVRVIAIVVPLVIAGLIVLPDPFPVWMKVQQGLCALAMAGAAVFANRPAVRGGFAAYREARDDASPHA